MAEVKQEIAGITLADLMQLDEDKREEVVNGIIEDNTIVTGFEHRNYLDNFLDSIRPFVKKHKLGYMTGDGLTYILHMEENENGKVIQQTRIPDASFFRKGQAPDDWDRKRPLPFAPDLAVEVVSPTEKTTKLMAKISAYLEYGTEQVWVIYPAKRELHQYFAEDNAPRIYGEQDMLQAETLFPNFTLTIADIFVDAEI